MDHIQSPMSPVQMLILPTLRNKSKEETVNRFFFLLKLKEKWTQQLFSVGATTDICHRLNFSSFKSNNCSLLHYLSLKMVTEEKVVIACYHFKLLMEFFAFLISDILSGSTFLSCSRKWRWWCWKSFF